MNLTTRYALVCTTMMATATATFAADQGEAGQHRQNVPLQGQSQIFFRADKLVGQSAQTTVGQNLGKITEIVFNTEKGVYGVIKTEKDRLVAVPWTLVTAVTDKAVVFNTSPQDVASAPTFTDKQWGKLNDPQFTQQLRSHFKVQDTSMGGSSAKGTEGVSSGQGSQDANSATKEPSTNSAASDETK